MFLKTTLLFCLTLCLFGSDCFAQKKTDEELIAASQASASSVFFQFSSTEVPVVVPGSFYDDTECVVRGGLPQFFGNAKNNKTLRIAYLGGSITFSNVIYRTQSAKFIQSMFPGVKVEGINAGVSGTDADLGVCRLYEHVLQYKPDLLFVEFAVNGGFAPGVEGIIRQTKKLSPLTSVCLIYTARADQLKIYGQGKVPEVIQGLERVADHYNIPSIHLAEEPAFLEKQGKLIGKSNLKSTDSLLVFSQDGVHPLQEGGNLYAAAIARAMAKLQGHKSVKSPDFPSPLFPDNWENAHMFEPLKGARFSGDWQSIDPAQSGLGGFKTWFPYIMKAEKPGSEMTIKFKGNMFGFFDVGGPEAGQLDLLVDGHPVKLSREGSSRYKIISGEGDNLNRFNSYCNNRYRGQFVCIELPEGAHLVSLKISGSSPDKKEVLGKNQLEDITQNPAKYDRSVVYMGKILIRGELVD
ncbi:SGNH/GDSL hydrolase family protein [Dyadobacter psychrotolerans]|uniref:SGNH/GDSL hydrolase family protein n=1 Tax=Dyadobacter psychrotolerans TaxID=2541721 RepID=A0A4R5DI80_9BACT|nr:SGNH/GDSL hydrolase family protein [Dyadobacter psychrotolerans]TDE11614.1 SGNH/GDSL hydrolase family protein [Dyadobacter psychrotolerans]